MPEFLCVTCVHCIYCPTWTEFKCLAKSKRTHGETSCELYKKRGRGFKERQCMCEDCLKNEDLKDELEIEE